MSTLGFPDTVTVPGLLRWWNCRWLPLVRTWNQPSASSRAMSPLTFTANILRGTAGAA